MYCSFIKCLLTCIMSIMAMSHSNGGRHGHCLDKWLKEFRWLQTWGSGDDVLMICSD